ncbi:hypothetical protein DL95DRAFT_122280 [Leptodontidium sp. 2 PMI_412]|nr:hypothetical protein DL95DRAFT_122280 [Leptodontidium sp. 2 PMI_412]
MVITRCLLSGYCLCDLIVTLLQFPYCLFLPLICLLYYSTINRTNLTAVEFLGV